MDNEMKERLEMIVQIHRCIAEEAIDDIMAGALTEMGNFLSETEILGGNTLEFKEKAAGFRPEILEKVKEHAIREDMDEWILKMDEVEKWRIILCFLNVDARNRKDFRSKFPNAFKKWSAEDDAALLAAYGNAKWKDMEERFGRNTNALKLRLQKLGVDLGQQAVTGRY